MDKLLSAIADKLDEPCWLIALAVVALAAYSIRKAHAGAAAEGERTLAAIRMTLDKKEDHDA